MAVSDKSKLVYLILLIIFIFGLGFFWLDYIGMVDLEQAYRNVVKKESESVLYVSDDEPSLIDKEEFEKQKALIRERKEKLDELEVRLLEEQKELESTREKLEEIKRGLDLEKKQQKDEKKKIGDYKRNVKDLANKITNMPPEESIGIMVKWDDPLIIDVLRQMDANASEAGTASITSYLLSLMPKDKAGQITYLMTQIN